MSTSPFFDTWARVAGLYRDAAQSSAQHLTLSSAAIVQEHTMRAFLSAAQACTDALAKNAISVQQKSFERFADANLKALGIMGNAYTAAWTGQKRTAR
jgi:hypothetical protein